MSSRAWRTTRRRRYHFVIVSDHGQSQGLPFEDLYGHSLGDVCSELTREDVVSLEENVESWGRVESVLDDLASGDGAGQQTAARAATRMQARAAPDEGTPTAGDLVVLGSGNLGLVYVRGTGAAASRRRSTNAGLGCSPASPQPRGSVSSPC